MNEILLACLVLLGGFGLAAAFLLWTRRLGQATLARQQELEKLGPLERLAAAPQQSAFVRRASRLLSGCWLIVLYVVVLPAGLAFFAFALMQLGYRIGLGGPVIRTEGVVVGLRETTESGVTYLVPQVRVVTPYGEKFTVEMGCAPLDCFPGSQVGTRVPVVYPRDHAWQLSIMADNWQGWLTDLFLLLIGGVAVAGMVDGFSKLGRYLRRRRGNSTPTTA